jgi:2,3-bisphosphoglycerate-independent phosphoglycerate mutase
VVQTDGHTPELVAVQRPVLLVILDGFGFNPRTEAEILRKTIARLSATNMETILHIAVEAWREASAEVKEPGPDGLLRLVLSPVLPTIALESELSAAPFSLLQAVYAATRARLTTTVCGDSNLLAATEAVLVEEAQALRYAVWYARSPYLNSLRNQYPTVPTQAAGSAAGYEDVVPAVQGNSETGHQQIGNFIVAAQTPLEISTEIADGRFFTNPALLEALAEVKRRGTALDVCFLLSGEYGNDGRVHSAWNHLEALLEAAFVHAERPPSRVRIEAITDGRDSPPYSSLQMVGEQYGFLPKLRALLARYGAEQSLAWVIGRSIAMDRDYEEARTAKDFRMLVEGDGILVDDFAGAIAAVEAFHAQGLTDPNIPPIVVGSGPRCIEAGDVFLDLNFRADRQRAKVAALLGAREFLSREAGKRGQKWNLDWVNPPHGLTVYCLSEYHPDLENVYGAKVLYPIRPQAHNLFALLPEVSQAQGFRFHYLLTAESTKALHVGYFIRGRREVPTVAEDEERVIVPSYGPEFGVATDDDYYKTPQMRAFALADLVVESLARGGFDLIAVNFSNTDMIGHLLPKQFVAAERSITLIDTVLETVVPAALRAHFDVIITADHGNVEDNDSSHTANEILTTFVSADRAIVLRHDPRKRARLFDIPWSIVESMGLTDEVIPHLPPIPAKIQAEGLVGRSLVRVETASATARRQSDRGTTPVGS